YIKKLQNKDLINFRDYLKSIKKSAKKSTLNNILTNITTFINYCKDTANYIQNTITKNIKINKTIKDEKDTVQGWSDKDIQILFDNIKSLTHTSHKNIARKYEHEYLMIIKLAMYTGSRESEILQLTKEDIKRDVNNILYIDINVNEKKSIKNISSIRHIPVHRDLEKDLLEYISHKRKILFKITLAIFSKQFSDYKTKLGFEKTIKVFHSFRHTLQDKLKQNMVQNMVINELTGHSQDDSSKMTDRYTNKYSLKILKEELDKIKYEIN
ncbi:MAG: tyrosine-type recombinase/integrase, partial [Campylobacterota bacterium]|nr:tyrosine-type recombinase/integrase [Campylobacterota bacterium]